MLKNKYVDEELEFGFDDEDEGEFVNFEEEVKELKRYFRKNKFRGKRLYIAG